MHVAEAVPHFSPKVAKNDVLSKKTQKTQVSETLAIVSGPSLARVSEIWVFFWFFGTVRHFGLVMVINLGQLQQNAWFSKKI